MSKEKEQQQNRIGNKEQEADIKADLLFASTFNKSAYYNRNYPGGKGCHQLNQLDKFFPVVHLILV